MDDECNFLLQVRGQKFMHVFDFNDRTLVSEQQLERFSMNETPFGLSRALTNTRSG